jgi:hypothetical protein
MGHDLFDCPPMQPRQPRACEVGPNPLAEKHEYEHKQVVRHEHSAKHARDNRDIATFHYPI